MRTVFTALIVSLLMSACTTSNAPQVSTPRAKLVDNQELIVLIEPPAAQLIATAESMNYVVTANYALDDLEDVLVVFRIPDGTTIPRAIEEIEIAVPGVTAGAHHLYRLQMERSDVAELDYANAMLGWPATGCLALRPVGLIDAGLPSTYPGVAEGQVVTQRFVDSEAEFTNDHGSLMAALLVGEGRLKGTTLFSADVVDPERAAGDSAGVVAILRAVNWLKSAGVDIVNISLAGPRNKLMARAFETAAKKGMRFVAAAGNQGPESPPLYPAAFPFVLAVTAIDREGNVYKRAIRGDHIDFAAPGVDILIETDDRMRIFSGTSAAAPFLTAAIAADTGLSSLNVDMIRSEAAKRTIDLGTRGKDSVFGVGMLGVPEACVDL